LARQEKETYMLLRNQKPSLWKCAAVFAAAGTLFGGGCTSEQIQAIAAGLGALAEQLDDDYDDDISFGDWLTDEIEDW
jgi:hypothetical protein